MTEPKKPTPAETLVAISSTLPKHPAQDRFMATAIKLLAEAIMAAVPTEAADRDPAFTERVAMTGATADFETGLTTLVFDPSAQAFVAVWASPEWCAYLRPYLDKAWETEPELFGERPRHFEPKAKNGK